MNKLIAYAYMSMAFLILLVLLAMAVQTKNETRPLESRGYYGCIVRTN